MKTLKSLVFFGNYDASQNDIKAHGCEESFFKKVCLEFSQSKYYQSSYYFWNLSIFSSQNDEKSCKVTRKLLSRRENPIHRIYFQITCSNNLFIRFCLIILFSYFPPDSCQTLRISTILFHQLCTSYPNVYPRRFKNVKELRVFWRRVCEELDEMLLKHAN